MEDFSGFEQRLTTLDDEVRTAALRYASEYFADNECSREEALEKGIAKAEMKKRKL